MKKILTALFIVLYFSDVVSAQSTWTNLIPAGEVNGTITDICITGDTASFVGGNITHTGTYAAHNFGQYVAGHGWVNPGVGPPGTVAYDIYYDSVTNAFYATTDEGFFECRSDKSWQKIIGWIDACVGCPNSMFINKFGNELVISGTCDSVEQSGVWYSIPHVIAYDLVSDTLVIPAPCQITGFGSVTSTVVWNNTINLFYAGTSVVYHYRIATWDGQANHSFVQLPQSIWGPYTDEAAAYAVACDTFGIIYREDMSGPGVGGLNENLMLYDGTTTLFNFGVVSFNGGPWYHDGKVFVSLSTSPPEILPGMTTTTALVSIDLTTHEMVNLDPNAQLITGPNVLAFFPDGRMVAANPGFSIYGPNTGISSVTASPIHIFPNPVTDFISVSGIEDAAGDITDLSGRVVRTFSSSTIDLMDLVPGIYFIRIQNDGKNFVGKVVKQ